MIRSVVLAAIRNLIRNRSFSAINLIGLSVAMSLGMLVLMVVRDQFTFDLFHHNADRIYRINTRALRMDGGAEPYASAPLSLGKAIANEYTFASSVVRIYNRLRGDVTYENVHVSTFGFFADPSFLSVFNFPLAKGDPATALTDPKGIVLTQLAAHKIFGDRDPLGQSFTLVGYGEFHVTGVLAPFPNKTHFEFEVIGSTNALLPLQQASVLSPSMEKWTDYYSSYVYFVLRDGASIEEAHAALDQIVKQHFADVTFESRDRGIEFFTQNLMAITPGPILSNQMGKGLPDLLLVFMSALAGIVLLMACFNYTNLMIAKSLTRAREIGMRKVMGARRGQVFGQLIGEAIVFALASLIVSYGLLQVLKPVVLQLHIASEFEVNLQEDVQLVGWFLVFALAIGTLAGVLPAGYLSAFRPASVLKDAAAQKVYSRLTLRKGLVVTQFSLSVIFVIVVLVIYGQIDYMLNKDYGINEKNIYNIRLQGLPFEKLRVEALKIPGVVQVGGVSHQLGTWSDRASDYRRQSGAAAFGMRDFLVDDRYIDNLDIEFVAGNNFDPASESANESHVILNEKALPLFGFTDPASAIGETIYADDSLMLSVVGVVKDFHFRPLSYQIGPMALRYRPSHVSFASLKIAPGSEASVVAEIIRAWKVLDPVHPFEGDWMANEIDGAYERAGFHDILTIVGYVCFLAVVLACLGMLGMAMYSTQVRRREIGIRKVMGADAWQVVIILSRSFLILIGIALLFGLPAGYALGKVFLETYAYRIPISIGLMMTGTSLIVGLGAITIASQTWKAASINPAITLRYE